MVRRDFDPPIGAHKPGINFRPIKPKAALIKGGKFQAAKPLWALVWATNKTLVHSGDSTSTLLLFDKREHAKSCLKGNFSENAPIVIVKLDTIIGEVK